MRFGLCAWVAVTALGACNGVGEEQRGADASPSADGSTPGDSGVGSQSDAAHADAAAVPALRCEPAGGGARLLDLADREVATYDSVAVCEEVVAAAGEGVVCVWFTPDMPVGPGGWSETGWRPMNVETGVGLGRRPHLSYEDCLDATTNARGGVVCTNTGVGYKSAHIETNMWCGASSNLHYCTVASLAARGYYVCSFPSEGDGSGPGWVLTEIQGTTCDYISSQMPLDDCNAMIPD